MDKNKKTKTTRKIRKKIYSRHNDQDRLSSRTSVVDVYYDPANDLLKRKVHYKIPLTYDEEVELGSILKLFKGFECENDKTVCKSDTCRFAGTPDGWVIHEDFPCLCDLVYHYTKNGPNLDPPKGGDAMGCRMPGDGFRYH